MPPFIEGAWMTKHNGKYYLQYGAPGTEFSGYGDGVYVSDKPLEGFTYQSHNPFLTNLADLPEEPDTELHLKIITKTGGIFLP